MEVGNWGTVETEAAVDEDGARVERNGDVAHARSGDVASDGLRGRVGSAKVASERREEVLTGLVHSLVAVSKTRTLPISTKLPSAVCPPTTTILDPSAEAVAE